MFVNFQPTLAVSYWLYPYIILNFKIPFKVTKKVQIYNKFVSGTEIIKDK